jgi:hypothetical protein
MSNPFECKSLKNKTRLMKVLQKTPRGISKVWGSRSDFMPYTTSLHDVYFARNIKRNLADFRVLQESMAARATVVNDLYAARNRASKWKDVELRSKDLFQKHADELRLEELELFSKTLYKLVTEQFAYVRQATEQRFSESVGRFVAEQSRKCTHKRDILESTIKRLK